VEEWGKDRITPRTRSPPSSQMPKRPPKNRGQPCLKKEKMRRAHQRTTKWQNTGPKRTAETTRNNLQEQLWSSCAPLGLLLKTLQLGARGEVKKTPPDYIRNGVADKQLQKNCNLSIFQEKQRGAILKNKTWERGWWGKKPLEAVWGGPTWGPPGKENLYIRNRQR